MSARRTDHAAKAEALLARADECADSVEAAILLRAAEAHATLALAEEQRIANLIAYCASAETPLAQGHKEWIEQEWGIGQ